MSKKDTIRLLKGWFGYGPLTTSLSALTDPNHQRAGGNLRYFEQLLMKQLKESNQDYQPPSEEPIQLGTYTRPKDHLPERETYEALCRGEGLQLVRAQLSITTCLVSTENQRVIIDG